MRRRKARITVVLFVVLLLAHACDRGGCGSAADSRDPSPRPELAAGTLLVEIGPGAIYLDGQEVLALDHGRVSARDRRSPTGLRIEPLYGAIRAKRSEGGFANDERHDVIQRVRLRSHPLVATGVFRQVVFTLRQAQEAAPTLEWRVCDVPECRVAEERGGGSLIKFIEPDLTGVKPRPPKNDDEKARLTLVPRTDGIQIIVDNARLPPRPSCSSGPTICTRDSTRDSASIIRSINGALYAEKPDEDAAMEYYEKLLDSHRFDLLYEVVVMIKDEFPDATSFQIEFMKAGRDIPMGLVREISEHMRSRLPQDAYDSTGEYRAARASIEEVNGPAPGLFPSVCPPLEPCWAPRPVRTHPPVDPSDLGAIKPSDFGFEDDTISEEPISDEPGDGTPPGLCGNE